MPVSIGGGFQSFYGLYLLQQEEQYLQKNVPGARKRAAQTAAMKRNNVVPAIKRNNVVAAIKRNNSIIGNRGTTRL